MSNCNLVTQHALYFNTGSCSHSQILLRKHRYSSTSRDLFSFSNTITATVKHCSSKKAKNVTRAFGHSSHLHCQWIKDNLITAKNRPFGCRHMAEEHEVEELIQD